MEKKQEITISEALYKRIDCYCNSNGLSTHEKCEEWLNNALNKELYGDIPFGKLSSDEGRTDVDEGGCSAQTKTLSNSVEMEKTINEIEKPIKPTKRRL